MPKRTKGSFLALTLLTLVAGTTASPSFGKPHKGGPNPPSHRPGWHGDIHRFHDNDMGHWRSGRWHHGPHDGRYGWWWIVGSLWYFYPAPVYPYPDPFVPSTVIIETTTPAPSGSQYWYCGNPAGYYPYVAACYGTWQAVAPGTTTIVETAPAQPAPPPVAQTQRDVDFDQLNAYSLELSQIHSDAPNARGKLRSLENRVESFRKTLLQRSYNAMDILRDTEDLKNRIEQKRAPTKKHY